ncbi:MAG: hypothetical protein Q8891_14015 [Bacteroidota bacterium]|jgi:hypothetical protein|nr:hypothetical protein [Bacteroidota bacterium]
MKFIIFLLLPVFGKSQLPSNTQQQTLKYEWRKISGPSQYKIETPNLALTNVSNLVEGIYQFELKVTNRYGLSARDTMVLTVKPPDNNASVKQVDNSILSKK